MPGWLPILSAGVVTALGWFASYYFGKLKEDRTRRLELRINYLQRQVEEFYGPLYNLVTEIVVSKQVMNAIVAPDGPSPLTTDPPSFHEYLRHAIQERLQREIWTHLKIGTTHVHGRPFPETFQKDIESGLLAVMRKYDDTIAELSPRRRVSAQH